MLHDTEVQQAGVLRGIAFRATDGEAMIEIAECSVVAGRGIDRENRKTGKREVTFLSAESWADTCRDLGAELPWHTRRANFLVEGVDLASAVGRIIGVGPVRVRVHGETKPCRIMDEQSPGLCAALVPAFRGGVFGEVLVGGSIRVGDSVVVED